MEDILKLITTSYDEKEVKKFQEFKPDKEAIDTLIRAGKEVLTLFPNIAGACVPMSALWTCFIRDNTNYPIHMVAGSLYLDNNMIFGDNANSDNYKNTFECSNLDWNGHCWIIFGNLICDISIFRTAYSGKSSKELEERLLANFGQNSGLFLCSTNKLVELGFRYEAEYILNDNEITNMFNSARAFIHID